MSYSKETSPIVVRVTGGDTICDNVNYRLIINANKERVEHEYCEADKATLHKLVDSQQLTIDTLRAIIGKQAEVNDLQKQNTIEEKNKSAECQEALFVFEKKAKELVTAGKKEKRKSFWKGFGIGLGSGLVAGVISTTVLVIKLQ